MKKHLNKILVASIVLGVSLNVFAIVPYVLWTVAGNVALDTIFQNMASQQNNLKLYSQNTANHSKLPMRQPLTGEYIPAGGKVGFLKSAGLLGLGALASMGNVVDIFPSSGGAQGDYVFSSTTNDTYYINSTTYSAYYPVDGYSDRGNRMTFDFDSYTSPTQPRCYSLPYDFKVFNPTGMYMFSSQPLVGEAAVIAKFQESKNVCSFLLAPQVDTATYNFDNPQLAYIPSSDIGQDSFNYNGEQIPYYPLNTDESPIPESDWWGAIPETSKPLEYQGLTPEQAVSLANSRLNTSNTNLSDFDGLPVNPNTTDSTTSPEQSPQIDPDIYQKTDPNTGEVTFEQIDYRGYLQSIINNTDAVNKNVQVSNEKLNQIDANTNSIDTQLKALNDNINTEPTLLDAPTFEQSNQKFYDGLLASPLISSLVAPSLVGSSTCPTFDFDLNPMFNSVVSMDLHCQILAEYQTEWFALMVFLYSFIALVVFLKA